MNLNFLWYNKTENLSQLSVFYFMEGESPLDLHTLKLFDTPEPSKSERGLLLEELHKNFIKYHSFVIATAPATIRNYCQTFDLLLKFKSDVTNQDLTENFIINFFEYLNTRPRKIGKVLVARKLKNSTIAGARSNLNVFFIWLKKHNYILVNPFERMKYPIVTHTDARAFTPKEVEKILHSINSKIQWANLVIKKRNIAIVMFLLFTGVRKNELLNVKLRDIDIEQKIVYIRSENSKSKRGRIISLNVELIPYLQDYLHYRIHCNSEWLWISGTQDNKFTSHGMKHLIRLLTMVTKINCHLHRFRHTFAIAFYKATHDILSLKKLMGHTNLAMTLTYLRSLADDHTVEQIRKLSINEYL